MNAWLRSRFFNSPGWRRMGWENSARPTVRASGRSSAHPGIGGKAPGTTQYTRPIFTVSRKRSSSPPSSVIRKTVAAATFSAALVHCRRPPSMGLMTRCWPLMSKMRNLPRRQLRSKVPPVSWRANSSGGVRSRKLSLGDVHTWAIRFPSRAGLLKALELEPEPGARQRVLEVALRLLGTRALANLSMDELAAQSGISRANLYRLFPGKTALFRAILIAYSPFEPVMALFDRVQDHPPEHVI